MKFLNHNLFTGDITVSGITTLSTATGVTRATGDNSTHFATTAFVKNQGYATTAALAGYVPITRTITINGTTLDLSADRTWTIEATQTVRTVYETVKNVSGATILKGTPLAVVAGQTSGNVADVIPADAADPTKMPAIFIANQDIPNEAEGEAVLFGNLTGVDTSAYISGTTVYVAPGGGWTATKPVWPNKIQNLGIITKQHPSNGAGIVTGVGRANDLPNLTAGKIWVGSANYPIESTTVHVDEANGRVGIGTTSPGAKLDVNGAQIIQSAAGFGTDGDQAALFFSNTSNYGLSGNFNGYSRNLIKSDGTSVLTVGRWNTSLIGELSIESGSSGLIRFFAGASERMRITSTGNIGIGTTSPNYKLDVNGEGQIGYINFEYNANYAGVRWKDSGYNLRWKLGNDGPSGHWLYLYDYSNSSAAFTFKPNSDMLFTPGGNVGIGTSTTVSKLHVSTTGANAYSSTITKGSNMKGIVNTLSNNADDMVGIYFATGTNAEGTHWSGITGSRSQSATDWSTQLNFYTHNEDVANITDATQKMVIKGSGNVGIGTTSPSFKLDVNGNIRTQTGYIQGANSSADLTMDGNIGTLLRYGGQKILQNSAETIFYTADTIRLNIKNDGKIGIGTTTPTTILDVNGSIRVTGRTTPTTGNGLEIFYFSPSDCFYLEAYNYSTSTYKAIRYSGASHQFIAGNVGVGTTNPIEKLHVAGNIRIDGSSTAAILETGDKTADEGGVIFEDYDLASTYGAFVDYVIYDTTRDNMRAGTFYAVWNTGQAVYTDTSTVDIGDTSNVVLYAEIDGTSVNLIVNGPTSFTIKYNLKLIK
jgi:hypothetical protein